MRAGRPGLKAWNEWQANRELGALDTASLYGLPAVYLNLREFGDEIVQRNELSGLHFANCTWTESATDALLEVIALFEAAGVPLMLLKGLPISLFYYRDFGARLMIDIDLLIRPSDVHAAAEILRRGGWECDARLPPKWLLPFTNELEFHHSRHATIDLHWKPLHLDCPSEVDQAFWDRAVPREVQGEMVLTPDTADLLLITCFNTWKGQSPSACRWVSDAAVLVRSSDLPIDWDVFLEQTKRAGLVPAVQEALASLDEEFGVNIPETVLTRVRSATADAHYIGRREARLLVLKISELNREGLWGRYRALLKLVSYDYWLFSAVRRAQGNAANPWAFPIHVLRWYQFRWGPGSQWHALRKRVRAWGSHST